MIEKAELKFGERDKSYTILGIELTEAGNPYILYRGANNKQIIIRINQDCLNDLDYSVFQVSQEIIHCLRPTGGTDASVLEEGLATYFGNDYYKNCGYSKWRVEDPKYLDALNLTKELLSIDSEIIKKIRDTEPIISKITKDQLVKINAKIPDSLAEKLTQKF